MQFKIKFSIETFKYCTKLNDDTPLQTVMLIFNAKHITLKNLPIISGNIKASF